MSDYDKTIDPVAPVEGGNGEPKQDWNYQPNDEGAIPIPVRIGSRLEDAPPVGEPPVQAVADEDDAIVREYERKYYRQSLYNDQPVPQPRVGDSHKQKRQWDFRDINVKVPPKHRYQTRAMSGEIQDTERTWAAIAHGSALLTILVAIAAAPGVLLTVLIPLGIYLAFRNKSEFVAFHALQAFTIQVVGTVGALVLLLAGGLVLGTLIAISALLSLVLIGIPFLIFFVLLLVALVVFSVFILPLGMVVYSMIAADAAYKGRTYRYPYIADWLDDQLKNGMLGSVI